MLNLFGINVKDAREKVFLSADAKKVLTPKKSTVYKGLHRVGI